MTSNALLDAATMVLGSVLEDGRRRDLNEANTRTFLIEPILSALGYNTLDRLSQEVYLPGAGESVDYVLTTGERRIFVEAKALNIKLGEKEAIQLVRYCSHQPVRWALLTNGVEWHIFDTDVSGDWQAKRVAEIDLAAAHHESQLDHALRPLSLFAHDAVGKSDAELSAWSQRERARSHLDELLGNPGSTAVKAIVASMRKGGIQISPSAVVDLLRARTAAPAPVAPPRHVAEEPASYGAPAPSPTTAATPPRPAPTRRRRPRPEPDTGVQFYLFPASEHDGFSGLDHLKAWLSSGMWGLWPSTPFRRAVKSGDQCCFYAAGVGIVALAEITGTADREIAKEAWPGPTDWASGTYMLPLRDIRWMPQPVPITPELRGKMDAYQGKDLSRPWSWLVQRTFRLTEHDFQILTGRG